MPAMRSVYQMQFWMIGESRPQRPCNWLVVANSSNALWLPLRCSHRPDSGSAAVAVGGRQQCCFAALKRNREIMARMTEI